MASLSEEVGKIESERRDLVTLAAEATRIAVGQPVGVFHVKGHYVLGHQGDEDGLYLEVELTRDLANEVACVANGVSVSGRR